MPSLPEHLKPLPVGRHKLPRDVTEEHQRARVLEAAIEVLAAKGYPATTVDDLVAAARIGVGSFYSHFSGKEQCLLATFELIAAEIRGTVVAAAGPAGEWTAQVCLGLQALLRWIEAEPARAKIAFVEVQRGGPMALERYEATLDEVAGFLKRGREAGDPAGDLPASLEQTTVSGIAWLLHHRLAVAETDTITELFGELAEMILEPYLGVAEAKEVVTANSLAASA